MSGEWPDASPRLREPDADPPLIPRTRRQVLAGTAAAAAMIAQLVFGKAARDASFLSTFELSLLPMAMISTAGLSAAGVVVVSRAMTRHSPARVVPWLFVTSASLFAGEALVSVWSPQAATAVFYVHMGVFGATVVSSFWSLVNEHFDPHAARRVVGRIATGGTLGGIAGSLIAWRVSAFLSLPALLLLLAALNALCFWGTRGLLARTKSPPSFIAPSEPVRSGFSHLRDTPYLRHLGWLVGFAGVSSSLLDYVVAARAASFASGRSLMAFFAILYMSIALVGFVVQLLLTRVSLEKLGVTGTVTTLPVAIAGVGLAAFALPGLATVVAVRAVEAVIQNSLFRSGYELLYTPVARARKRALKLIIDVGFERSGTAVGSAITLLVVWLLPLSAERLLLGGIVATAAAGVLISRRLHAGYVATLEQSMRQRSEDLDEREAAGATALQVVAGAEPLAMDLAHLQPGGRTDPVEAAVVHTTVGRDSLVDSIMDLRSGDPATIRRVLSADPVEVALVSHMIPLLGNDEVARDIVHALRSLAPRVSGQLVDALLDSELDTAIRRRIPRVLRVCESDSVVLGLTKALTDGVFDMRQQSALALAHITERHPDLSPSAAEVLAAVLREVATDKATWDTQRLRDALQDDDEHADDIMRERSRSLEHVFTLLSLVHDPEPLELSFRALGSEDDRLRGTALEYLENILSVEIRERLWPYLGDLREYRRSARSRDELIEELRQLAVLRRRYEV